MNRSAQPLPSGSRTNARRACQAEEADLTLKMVAHVLGAVIVAKGEAMGNVLGEGAKALAHALTDRLECLEAIGAAAGVKANALGRAMIDGHDCSVTVSAARVSSLQAAWPSPVITEVRSAPHLRSIRSVVIVPSWALGPRGRPARCGASRPCTRIRRSTRRRLVRMPLKRSRAHSLR